MHVLQARGPRTGPRIDAATLGLVFPVGGEVLVLRLREPPGKSSEDVPSRSGHASRQASGRSRRARSPAVVVLLPMPRSTAAGIQNPSKGGLDDGVEVDSHEEDAVRKSETTNVRRTPSLTPPRPRVRKAHGTSLPQRSHRQRKP
jgi:hypothetical protein